MQAVSQAPVECSSAAPLLSPCCAEQPSSGVGFSADKMARLLPLFRIDVQFARELAGCSTRSVRWMTSGEPSAEASMASLASSPCLEKPEHRMRHFVQPPPWPVEPSVQSVFVARGAAWPWLPSAFRSWRSMRRRDQETSPWWQERSSQFALPLQQSQRLSVHNSRWIPAAPSDASDT